MPQESLTRAYELTRTLLAAIEAGDWQFAGDISKERSPLLMSLGPDQSDEGLAIIREIQAMNAVIIEKARQARDACAARFTDGRRRIDAARLYRATEGLR
jgi:flagellar protein FliT